MKHLLAILGLILFVPGFAFASSNSVEIAIVVVLTLIIIFPYYIFALITYYIHRKYKGKSAFFSILTYTICLAAIILAYYQEFGFIIPNNLDGNDVVFFLKFLPFVTVMILAAVKDYKYSYEGEG